MTASDTLPSFQRLSPVRPWVASAMMSWGFSWASSSIAHAGAPLSNVQWTFNPLARSLSAVFFRYSTTLASNNASTSTESAANNAAENGVRTLAK